MKKHAVINLKTDPELKKSAAKVAEQLGVSISSVLNNELKRFATEKRIVFELPGVPNAKTTRQMKKSQNEREQGDYHSFESNEEALDFLKKELK